MPLVNGATAAGFSIVRQLEHEEFGELYVAEHPRLPRLQLLQLIPAEISADLDYREDFNEETDLAATLFHPNILGLTDRGEFEDQLWISTDYLDSNDAACVLGDHPDGMPPKLVLEIVSAIAEALDYAHDQGVLHRHVNPGNILISKGPSDKRRIALSGFGVARPIGDKTNTLTRANVMIGTASYTAPERLMDDAIDGRSDQYGLAASAFHLLTGSPPFAHFNPAVLISKHLNERPPRPSDIRPDLIEFDAIFARALAQDPVDRFRRCRDLVRALELNGGKRSHVRASSDFFSTSDSPDAGTTAMLTAPVNAGTGPTEPAPLAPPPATEVAAAVATPKALPKNDVDDVTELAETATDRNDAPADFDDDDLDDDAARSRRGRHTAVIAGTILVVLLAGLFGVKVLRTASISGDTPSSLETTSAEPTVTPAPEVAAPLPVAPPPPAPAPPAVVMSPRPPVVTTPAPVSTSRVAPAVTTTPTTPTTVPQTTRAAPTTPKSSTPPKTTPSGLDTRPALGMPCGPEQSGSAAVSNSGGPVNCVSTPGGFAWEPPGG